MKITLKQSLVAAACAGGALLLPSIASAQSYTYPHGYVCEVDYTTSAQVTNYGTSGYGWVSIYTSPHCAGSYVTSGTICTTGATDTTTCPTNVRFSEAGLLSSISNLHLSMQLGNNVEFIMVNGNVFQAIWTIDH